MLQRLRRAMSARASTAAVRSRSLFFCGVLLLSGLFAFVEPSILLRAEFLVGFALGGLGALTGIALWLLDLPARALVWLTVLDVAAAAMINVAAYEGTGTPIGLLVSVLPLLWLAYWFGYTGAAVATVGSFVITYAPAWYRSDWPRDGVGWVTLSSYPLAISIVAIAVAFSSLRFREAQRLHRSSSEQAGRLDRIFRTVIDQIDAWLVVFGRDGEVMFDNHALSHIGELSSYDPSNRGSRHVYGPDRVSPVPPEQQAVPRLLAGETVSNEIYWVGPRGRQRAVLVNGRPISAVEGGAIGSVIVLQDITEVQMELLEREESLASLSHELRSPLTSIVGYSDLMEEDLEGAPQARTAAIIRRSAEHMLALTESLLSAFRDGEAPQRSAVPVREIVERAVDMQRSAQQWGERTLRIEADEAIRADADPRQLLQILGNLIGNAVKYSPEGAVITVTAERDAEETRIRVHNTGEPIPEQQLERIFDRFYRRPGAETGTSRGLGIGLALSRRMAAAHGGSLTASGTGDGTEFLLQLPNGL